MSELEDRRWDMAAKKPAKKKAARKPAKKAPARKKAAPKRK